MAVFLQHINFTLFFPEPFSSTTNIFYLKNPLKKTNKQTLHKIHKKKTEEKGGKSENKTVLTIISYLLLLKEGTSTAYCILGKRTEMKEEKKGRNNGHNYICNQF